MMNLIFALCIYPVVFLMYFTQKNEGVSTSGILFGIKYTSDWLPDSERELLQKEYRHTMNRYLLIFSLIPLPAFFIPSVSISFTVWMIWMLVMIVMFMIPFGKGNNKLKKIKLERCPQESIDEIRYAETKNAGIIRRVKWQQFVPPCGISIILAMFALIYFFEKDLVFYGTIISIFALCSIFFYGCAVWMDRMKTKIISTDSDVNVNYTRASKNIIKNFWLQCTWLNVIFLTVLLIGMIMEAENYTASGAVIIWSIVIFCLLTLWFCMKMAKKIQRLSRRYAKKMDVSLENDEKYWIGGILYCNPKDKHTLVDKRVGIGSTMNMATPAGMAITAFSVLALLSIPIICIWMMLLEFVPISLLADENVLIARQLRNDYVIEVNSITELTLEDELPRTSRISGTGMDNLLKGNFRNSTDGRFEIFLNPENKYYLRIVSEDTIYYLGGYDDEETLAVYELLINE